MKVLKFSAMAASGCLGNVANLGASMPQSYNDEEKNIRFY
jgi:hypothetical protein